ncbi:hypothetical protein ANOM_000809 [Aspergillus nomiae NRRL 13137]|uniref:Extracellular thaumatin domain protein n=1 Tax=Aspergillus nomiae NRRL (strain ATCC 15546 / NRRL 13137 / CBS 260.88 / M93) TaxID=1509407 RepID=A0A0L1JH51_ASPN3|nr:uncharacterized protein ANOM_000809 [Aspergillus nomiae NRRL 13137]KNG91022.1 hypothetical protein ANOM_000809 [Aspergillus nomiae NRRL 13137]
MMSLTNFILFILALLSVVSSESIEEHGSAISLGNVAIVNNMGTTLYLWSVDATQGPMHAVVPGASYQETYRLNPKGGGISIKVSTDQNVDGDIIQFEYTQAGEKIFWNVSCVNTKPGSPFYAKGLILMPSNTKDCPHAFVCLRGDSNCRYVYHKSNDDSATHGCPIGTSFNLKLGI